jgi:DNA-3-methyladenine glycosylase I
MSARLHTGTDGIVRCSWCGDDDLYQRYHDTEWGVTLHGETKVFEKIVLEGMQAGLSWITILRKRETFREAFAGFDIETVAGFDDSDVQRLMGNPGVIRNRAKIDSAISNARITASMLDHGHSLDELVWSFAPVDENRRAGVAEHEPVVPETAESKAMSKELKKRGFRFVGPTTMYAFMQSSGMVNDHMLGCHRV